MVSENCLVGRKMTHPGFPGGKILSVEFSLTEYRLTLDNFNQLFFDEIQIQSLLGCGKPKGWELGELDEKVSCL